MASPRRSTFVIVALCICALLSGARAAQAEMRVVGTTFFVNGKPVPDFQYSGTCPVWLRFYWSLIDTDFAGMVYYFIPNVGKPTPRHSQSVWRNQPIPAYIDWQVGANTPKYANYRGWLQLRVTNPNNIANTINFTLHCR